MKNLENLIEIAEISVHVRMRALLIFAVIILVSCKPDQEIDQKNLPLLIGEALTRNDFHWMVPGDTLFSKQLTSQDQALILDYLDPKHSSTKQCNADNGFYALACGSCSLGCDDATESRYKVGTAIFCSGTNKFVGCIYCFPGIICE